VALRRAGVGEVVLEPHVAGGGLASRKVQVCVPQRYVAGTPAPFIAVSDNGFNKPEESNHNWVLANQRMAAVLKAKGYHYHCVFSKASGHVDGKVVGQTLPEALLWLWRGYPTK
jgi:hypothetical protein